GAAAGKVYVEVTEAGKAASERTEVSYEAEAQSTKVAADKVTIVNNVGKADTVTVTDLTAGTIVKVYDLETAGKVLGTATVAATKTEAVLNITQLGAAAGKVYVEVTEAGKAASERTEVSYEAEAQSTKVAADKVTIVNNVGKADTVTVTDLAAGTIVKVYDLETAGKVLGTVTASRSEATISIASLGFSSGSVYVSVTEPGKTESDRVKADYEGEPTTEPLSESAVTIVNNSGKADTITVTGLTAGDIVKVYYKGTSTVAGSTVVSSGKNEAVISISQLGISAGSVEITLTNPGSHESTKVEVSFTAED
ncbi:hypothetical protein FHR92_005411, partial [Fontibacillus solani]|nr:hypothetical protein [Fontibacillus solani]